VGTELPRENSAIINRIVVDDPQADIAREEMRKAEARPQPPGTAGIPGLDATGGPVQPAPVAPQRSRQEHLRQAPVSRKEVKFGDYILGQTLGEGEFGKVKMGWKKDSTVQVAIKLIRKESLAGNTTRLPKIYREISILRELQHPNIVRLHEFVETERHMGIILEYASGGELFDYILNHRYLKDPAARRLFAQLVSGVGYLHKKGIVHRDLKLENLLLDRNKHIIITDFGFANTFDPNDELGEEIERNLHDKSYVKREGLDKIIARKDGREGTYRRGDLMQTSCGSPCYAAPELVVSDGLYTGRKVDVWSCGVILVSRYLIGDCGNHSDFASLQYAMLAGYLPFDDDPANPEGDNINLLYKYIVSTPLTFPEYVTPHARDLLRRILVPDPRKRADLFEVARHSWLSEYTHVVGFIGSTIKSEGEAAPTRLEKQEDVAYLSRSASVREPSTRMPASESKSSSNMPRHAAAASIGGEDASDIRRQQQQQHRDNKRNTVQLEYVPPFSNGRNNSVGGASATAASPVVGKTRVRPEGQGPVEVSQSQRRQDGGMPPPSRGGRDQRSTSEALQNYSGTAATQMSRPNTSGALGGTTRLPSRGNSYSQPSVAQQTNANAQGSFSQPKSNTGYIIASPAPGEQSGIDATQRPSSQTQPTRVSNNFSGPAPNFAAGRIGGHKRSSTLGSITDKFLNRSSTKRVSQQDPAGLSDPPSEKKDRRYPPLSMKAPIASEDAPSRPSTDSRRPSFGFSRKASRERDSSVQGRRSSRRFSLLPSNFSMNSILGRKEQGYESNTDDGQRQSDASQQPPRNGRPPSKSVQPQKGSRSPSGSTLDSGAPAHYDGEQNRVQGRSAAAPTRAMYDKALPATPGAQDASLRGTTPPSQRRPFAGDEGYNSSRLNPATSDAHEHFYQDPPVSAGGAAYPTRVHHEPASYDDDGYDDTNNDDEDNDGNLRSQTSLRPQQRKFGEGYDHGHGGSSSATRRVMDFFRRRGKDRGEV
jgi:protein-serine/threonine kinase